MTHFIGLSGTVMRRSLKDFGHILRWALKDGAPIPRTSNELDEWAAALDERVNELDRYEPGALLALADDQAADDPRAAARRGFCRRLVETPGVVSTVGAGETVDCSLYIRHLKYDVTEVTDAHFFKLRKHMLTPDDWPLMEAVDVWRHSKELSLGLHYAWSPRPPEDWRRTRREWAAFVRDVLSRSRTLDSELQVVNAVDAGVLPLGRKPLDAWRKLKPTFTPNTIAIWHDDSATNVCLKWMKEPGLVWTEHTLFAERLAQLSGCKYYGAGGLAADGSSILDADPKRAAIVSMDANREGKNLQELFSRNLITSALEGADGLQQLIGRTHRPGQPEDQVEVDILLGCIEHDRAWRRSWQNAEAVRDTTGASFKVLSADVDWPSELEVATYQGARWGLKGQDKDGSR